MTHPSPLIHFSKLKTLMQQYTTDPSTFINIDQQVVNQFFALLKQFSYVHADWMIDLNNAVILGDKAGGKKMADNIIVATLEELQAHMTPVEFLEHVNLGIIVEPLMAMLTSYNIGAEKTSLVTALRGYLSEANTTTDFYSHLKYMLETLVKDNPSWGKRIDKRGKKCITRKTIAAQLLAQFVSEDGSFQQPAWLTSKDTFALLEKTYHRAQKVLMRQPHPRLCQSFTQMLQDLLEFGRVRLCTFGFDAGHLVSAADDGSPVLAIGKSHFPLVRCGKFVSTDEELDDADIQVAGMQPLAVKLATDGSGMITNPDVLKFPTADGSDINQLELVRANHAAYKAGKLAKALRIPAEPGVTIAYDDNSFIGNNAGEGLDCISLHDAAGMPIDFNELDVINPAEPGIEHYRQIPPQHIAFKVYNHSHIVVVVRGSALRATLDPEYFSHLQSLINRVAVQYYKQQFISKMKAAITDTDLKAYFDTKITELTSLPTMQLRGPRLAAQIERGVPVSAEDIAASVAGSNMVVEF